MTSDATPIEQLPGLARDETSPVFKEPWQAEAFALAVRLSKAGYFTWSEWTTVLTQQIGAAQARGDRDLGDKYYEHWLEELEAICVAKNLVVPEALRHRTEQWGRCRAAKWYPSSRRSGVGVVEPIGLETTLPSGMTGRGTGVSRASVRCGRSCL
jgi:nitrile hydratase accessory protein